MLEADPVIEVTITSFWHGLSAFSKWPMIDFCPCDNVNHVTGEMAFTSPEKGTERVLKVGFACIILQKLWVQHCMWKHDCVLFLSCFKKKRPGGGKYFKGFYLCTTITTEFLSWNQNNLLKISSVLVQRLVIT